MTKPKLNEGEIYAGAIINQDGTGHHIILLAGDKDGSNWQDAMDWAKELGGDLPNRVEIALLFDQLKGQFQETWYWTNNQHASYPGYFWCQTFSNGGQNDGYHKSEEVCARAVSRVEFTND